MLQDIVPGSRVTVSVEFNAPVAEVRAAWMGRVEEFPWTRLDDTHWRIAGKIMAGQTVKLAYRDSPASADTDVASDRGASRTNRRRSTSPRLRRAGKSWRPPTRSLPLQFTAAAQFWARLGGRLQKHQRQAGRCNSSANGKMPRAKNRLPGELRFRSGNYVTRG